MEKARITLTSPNYVSLNDISSKIIDLVDKAGIKHTGAIPMPTRKLLVSTRKGPCGGGTETYERWQMRVHKRVIDFEDDGRTLRRVMRVEVPENVQMAIGLKGKK